MHFLCLMKPCLKRFALLYHISHKDEVHIFLNLYKKTKKMLMRQNTVVFMPLSP